MEILDRAVPLLKAGGRIAYITCSVLDEENGVQVRGFLARHPGFSVQPPAEVAQALGERAFMFGKAARLSAGGYFDDSADDRHRWLFRLGPAGAAGERSGGRLVIKRKRNSSIVPQSGPNLSAMIACLWNPRKSIIRGISNAGGQARSAVSYGSRTTRRRSIWVYIPPLKASKLARFVTAIQMVGSLLARSGRHRQRLFILSRQFFRRDDLPELAKRHCRDARQERRRGNPANSRPS